MSITQLPKEKVAIVRKIIIAVAIVVPLVVAALFKVKITGIDLGFLPRIYAGLNALTAFFLLLALLAVKRKNIVQHRFFIRICLLLSILFLLLYIAYHMTSDPTSYGGNYPATYYFILISHILLSIAVIPIVLLTYLFAWEGDFERHKKWNRFAFPIWLYVAVTGVIVYLMIAPFYPA
jgi:putative membrane protein